MMKKRTLFKDKAGNRVVREDHQLAVRNAKGKLVNTADSIRYLRKVGLLPKGVKASYSRKGRGRNVRVQGFKITKKR